MRAVDVVQGVRVSISPEVCGEVVGYGSSVHVAAQRLQSERFARVLRPRHREEAESASYHQMTEFSPELRHPIAVWQAVDGPGDGSARLVATAQVELASAMLTSRLIKLRPGSVSAELLAQGRVAEIGGFAAVEDISREALVAAIDAIVAASIQVAESHGIEFFWVFPRNGFMSLIRADVPGLLPPYHFTQSPDVAGWNEESPESAEFRRSGLRGISEEPSIFTLSRAEFARDFDERMKLLGQRTERSESLARLLPRAMVRAQRAIVAEASELRELSVSGVYDATDGKAGAGQMRDSFLPFAGEAGTASTYLRELRELGGAPVKTYKTLSYRLLDVREGSRVLDVGCGSGEDLLDLAEIVGPDGVVVGLDINPALVASAKEMVAAKQLSNVFVFEGNGEHLGFPAEEFDCVRADRALQHMARPGHVLREMWRVLRLDGRLTVTEPDWRMMAVYPGSAAGGDDDSALQGVLEWCQQHLAHPRIGRQLLGLLRGVGNAAWSDLRVDVKTFSYTLWPEVNAVLRLSEAAAHLAGDHTGGALVPEAPDVEGWLSAVETSSSAGNFFAAIPLFFGYGRKRA